MENKKEFDALGPNLSILDIMSSVSKINFTNHL